MKSQPSLDELLVRWQEAESRGAPISLEELCRDAPQLRIQVEAEVKKLQAWNSQSLQPTITRAPTLGGGESATGASGSIPTRKILAGRFRIIRPHAKGGLGEVFYAVDEELQRVVALKQIQGNHALHSESRSRFVREAELTATLDHPGIVPVYSLGTDESGRPFYAMRFVSGESLKDSVARLHTQHRKTGDFGRELRKLLRHFIDVCNTLEYAHSRGVLHRDLKPDNIMIGEFGETLVIDWGLAKKTSAKEASPTGLAVPMAPADDERTQAGAVLGTPQFMSPEQASGFIESLTAATDVYGLGATLYFVLCGKAPFEAKSLHELLTKVKSGWLSPPRERFSGVPAALDAIVMRAMAVRPASRYVSARELSDDVERWLNDEPVAARRDPLTALVFRWAKRNRTPVISIAATLLVALVALAVSVFVLNQERLRTRDAELLAIQHGEAAAAERDAALRAKKDADLQRAEAETQRVEADTERTKAVAERNEAERLRLLTVEQQRLTDELRKRADQESLNAEDERRRANAEKDRALTVAYSATMQSACEAWNKFDAEHAAELLTECRPDQRGWEWHFLWRQLHEGTSLLSPPDGRANDRMTLSPNGRQIAFATNDAVIIKDVSTKSEISIPAKWCETIQFAPQGNRIGIVDNDGLSVYEIPPQQAGTRIGRPMPDGRRLSPIALSFNAAGTELLCAYENNFVEWVNPVSGESIRSKDFSTKELVGLTISDDGQRLLVSRKQSVELWNLPLDRLLVSKNLFGLNFSKGGVFGSNGLIAVQKSSHMALLDSTTGSEIGERFSGVDRFLGFSPKGDRLFVADKTGRVLVWCTDVSPFRLSRCVGLHSFARDLRQIVFTDPDSMSGLLSDGSCRSWQLSKLSDFRPDIQITDGSENWSDQLIRSKAVVDDDGDLFWGDTFVARIVDRVTGNQTTLMRRHPVTGTSSSDHCVLSPDSKWCCFLFRNQAYDTVAEIWDAQANSLYYGFSSRGAMADDYFADRNRTAFRSKPAHLVLSDVKGRILLQDVAEKKATWINRKSHDAMITDDVLHLQLCFNGECAACLRRSGLIEVWKLTTGDKVHQWKVPFAEAVCAASDGKDLMAIAKDRRDMGIVDLETGTVQRVIPDNNVSRLAFDPTGKRIVAVTDGGPFVQIWDSATGACVFRLLNTGPDFEYAAGGSNRSDGGSETISDVLFSPNGNQLALVLSQRHSWPNEKERKRRDYVRILDGTPVIVTEQ